MLGDNFACVRIYIIFVIFYLSQVLKRFFSISEHSTLRLLEVSLTNLQVLLLNSVNCQRLIHDLQISVSQSLTKGLKILSAIRIRVRH